MREGEEMRDSCRKKRAIHVSQSVFQRFAMCISSPPQPPCPRAAEGCSGEGVNVSGPTKSLKGPDKRDRKRERKSALRSYFTQGADDSVFSEHEYF